MDRLTPAQQTDLRAYWLVQHGQDLDRVMLSGGPTLSDLYGLLAMSKGVDPQKAQQQKASDQEALLRRIAKHSGVSVEKIKGGLG